MLGLFFHHSGLKFHFLKLRFRFLFAIKETCCLTHVPEKWFKCKSINLSSFAANVSIADSTIAQSTIFNARFSRRIYIPTQDPSSQI